MRRFARTSGTNCGSTLGQQQDDGADGRDYQQGRVDHGRFHGGARANARAPSAAPAGPSVGWPRCRPPRRPAPGRCRGAETTAGRWPARQLKRLAVAHGVAHALHHACHAAVGRGVHQEPQRAVDILAGAQHDRQLTGHIGQFAAVERLATAEFQGSAGWTARRRGLAPPPSPELRPWRCSARDHRGLVGSFHLAVTEAARTDRWRCSWNSMARLRPGSSGRLPRWWWCRPGPRPRPASNMVTMPAATAARSISEVSARVKISRSISASGCRNSAIAWRPR